MVTHLPKLAQLYKSGSTSYIESGAMASTGQVVFCRIGATFYFSFSGPSYYSNNTLFAFIGRLSSGCEIQYVVVVRLRAEQSQCNCYLNYICTNVRELWGAE